MTQVKFVVAAALAGCLFPIQPASAHPGSGIVVTPAGEVYFVDNSPPPPEGTGKGIVWKIGRDGKLRSSADMGGGHWLALDTRGSFAHADFKRWFDQRLTPNFVRLTPSTFNPSLLLTDGSPFVIGSDGNLYFARRNLEVTRLSPDGKLTNLTPDLSPTTDKLGGITGLAYSPDGSLYAACPSAVLKIKMDGTVTTLVHPIELKDCDPVPDSHKPDPSLRGLDVDAQGVVYAAATGCRRVVKITPQGNVTTLLKSEQPWSPTGIALAGEDVYVLEFDDAPPTRWRPRVRKLQSDGKVTILATVTR